MEVVSGKVEVKSTEGSTATEIQKTKELTICLESLKLYETREEISHREDALDSLYSIVDDCVKEILIAQQQYDEGKAGKNSMLFTFGSFNLGVQEPGADIDTLCVGPSNVSRDDFFDVVKEKLKMNSEFSEISYAPEAYVPVISMKFRGISFDLLYAPIPRYLSKIPDTFDILDDNNIKNADEQTVRSLNGRRVAEEIKRLVPNAATFVDTLKAFKYWARKRGIYKNVAGYLGGVNCALLVAYACMCYPNASASVTLQKCFAIFAEWDWKEPMMLNSVMKYPQLGKDEMVWDPTKEKDKRGIFILLTPCYPSQNSCYNVMPSTKDFMISEFKRGSLLVQAILEGKEVSMERVNWMKLFEEYPFFTAFKYYVQVEIRATSALSYYSWSGFVESRMRRLVPLLENTKGLHTHIYTKGMEPPDEKYCMQFYIGFALDDSAPKDSLDLSLSAITFKEELLRFNQFTPDMQVEIRCLKNTSKVNELPDYLFPAGKPKRHHKRSRKAGTNVEENKSKSSKLQ